MAILAPKQHTFKFLMNYHIKFSVTLDEKSDENIYDVIWPLFGPQNGQKMASVSPKKFSDSKVPKHALNT